MNLVEERRAIRSLLNETNSEDASEVYYAYYHPDQKTKLVIHPRESSKAAGYVCLARTGMDLFRPVMSMRLPAEVGGNEIDLAAATELIRASLPDSAEVIITIPLTYRPLIGALFEIHKEELLKSFVLDLRLFQPIINVLVTKSETYNGLPRYVVRESRAGHGGRRGDIVASAGLNWQSSRHAELYVNTRASNRRQGFGRSVVAALVQQVLDSGRTPIYFTNADNHASIQLAESVGFRNTGANRIMSEASLRPHSLRLGL